MVNAAGQRGIQFEHSWGDGVAVMRYFNEVYDDCNVNQALDNSFDSPSSSSQLPQANVQRLSFQLDDELKQNYLQPAKREYDEKRNSVLIASAVSTEMNRKTLKPSKLGPDAMMQLAFQVV